MSVVLEQVPFIAENFRMFQSLTFRAYCTITKFIWITELRRLSICSFSA